MRSIDIILAIFTACAWGSYFAVSKLLLFSFPPLFSGGLRFLLLFIFTWPFLRADNIPLKKVFILSVIYTLNIIIIHHAINMSDNLIPLIVINEITVPISTLFGIVFLGERFTLKNFLGMIVAFIGLIMASYMPDASYVKTSAAVLTIIASLLFAFYNLVAKNLAKYGIMSILANVSLFTFPQFFLLSYFQETWPNFATIPLQAVISLLYNVLVCSLLANYIWFYLLRHYPLTKVMPFALLIPVFGCITTSISLNEQIDQYTVIGGMMTLIGIAMIVLAKNDDYKNI